MCARCHDDACTDGSSCEAYYQEEAKRAAAFTDADYQQMIAEGANVCPRCSADLMGDGRCPNVKRHRAEDGIVAQPDEDERAPFCSGGPPRVSATGFLYTWEQLDRARRQTTGAMDAMTKAVIIDDPVFESPTPAQREAVRAWLTDEVRAKIGCPNVDGPIERARSEAPFAPPPAMPISAAPPGLPPPPTPNAGQDDPGVDAGPTPEEERHHAAAMACEAELNPCCLAPILASGQTARDIVRAMAVACHMTALLGSHTVLPQHDVMCNIRDVAEATKMSIDEDEVRDIVYRVFEGG